MTDAKYAAELKRYIRHLQAELKAPEASGRTPPAPDPISDHAVLRYMEGAKVSTCGGYEQKSFRTTGAACSKLGLPDQVRRL